MVVAWLWSWWQRRRGAACRHREFVLYTRRGCHLCDRAWELLRREQARQGFSLTVVDVDANAELAARHGTSVPVVTVDGRVRFRGVVNPVLLRRLLRRSV